MLLALDRGLPTLAISVPAAVHWLLPPAADGFLRGSARSLPHPVKMLKMDFALHMLNMLVFFFWRFGFELFATSTGQLLSVNRPVHMCTNVVLVCFGFFQSSAIMKFRSLHYIYTSIF